MSTSFHQPAIVSMTPLSLMKMKMKICWAWLIL
ncbi:hypothetical protein BDE02_06G159900 [Populus trichocarpa]|nr:hypothetical protein BDE02_06G159900 [Populus trichocarpa]